MSRYFAGKPRAGLEDQIAALCPPGTAVCATRDDTMRNPRPDEVDHVRNAVPSRVREFVTARQCAYDALVHLGVKDPQVGRGPTGEPIWPTDFRGAITHCDRFRAAVAIRAASRTFIGIDAEPNEKLHDGVLASIASSPERRRLTTRAFNGVHWDKLVFCIKEAAFKAWYPATNEWLDFDEVTGRIEPGGFSVLRGPHPVPEADRARRSVANEISLVRGRWSIVDGDTLVAVATYKPPPAGEPRCNK